MINEKEVSAYKELEAEIKEGEVIESIVFNSVENNYSMEDFHLPLEFTNRPLTLEEARPYLYGWQVSGGFGGEEVVPFYVWTNERVLFIGCYDGSTWLESVPRNPKPCTPYTIGGG